MQLWNSLQMAPERWQAGTPTLLIDLQALDHNLRQMAGLTNRHGRDPTVNLYQQYAGFRDGKVACLWNLNRADPARGSREIHKLNCFHD